MSTVRAQRSLIACAALAVLAAGLALTGVAAGGKKGSVLMPPQSRFRGKSFEDWNLLQTERLVAAELGGVTDLPETVKGVRFLPGTFAPGEYEFDIEVRPGTPIVSPAFFVFGERYDDPSVPDDNPTDPIIAFIFETTHIQTKLDGQVLLDGFGNELADYGYGPTYFDEPIVYTTPQPRGPGLNAVAALFGVGIGSIFHPLPPGEHTLEVTTDSLFFGQFHTVYNITVSRP